LGGLVGYINLSRTEMSGMVGCGGRFEVKGGDVVEFRYPNPDDPRLGRVHKKGFSGFIKSASDEEVLEWAKLFPAWRDARFRGCPVFLFEDDGVVAVSVPKLRALRSDYYEWIKDLELPRAYYRFVTLTFYRSVGLIAAWKNVSRWLSACLHRIRVKFKRDYGVEVFYLWAIEVHYDGFPHVHLVFGLDRYVPELSFEVLLKVFREAWVDDCGNPLCAPQGVDIRYVGRDVGVVKEYLLKYLVKDHWKVWAIEVKDGVVRARLSTLLIWLFRVRLFGMSQKLKRPRRVKGGGVKFYGRVSLRALYRRVGFDVPYEEFKRQFLLHRSLKFDVSVLPVLVPSAFRGGVEVCFDDGGGIEELLEGF
jgi:hypothetical protein